MPLPSPMTITDRAAERVRALMAKADPEAPIIGVRVGVRTRGCSGLSYWMEYAEEQKRFEDVVEDKGVRIFIEPTATMFLLGTEMDWIEEDLGARFVFNNPNEVDRCGCGESFRVAPEVEMAAKAQDDRGDAA